MIRLKSLLTEETISRSQEREIVQTLYDVEDIIKRSLPKSDALWDGKLKWETAEDKFRGHIEKRPMGVNDWSYELSALVDHPSNRWMNIYAKSYLKNGDIVYKANVYSGSGVGNMFEDTEKMKQWIEEEIKNFEWPEK